MTRDLQDLNIPEDEIIDTDSINIRSIEPHHIQSDVLLEDAGGEHDTLSRQSKAHGSSTLDINNKEFRDKLVLMLEQILANTKTLPTFHEHSINLLPTTSNTALDSLTTETSQTMIDGLRHVSTFP